MTQEMFPEIQVATEALNSRIAVTETEIVQLKESIRVKKELVRSWRKALNAFSPRQAKQKKSATAH